MIFGGGGDDRGDDGGDRGCFTPPPVHPEPQFFQRIFQYMMPTLIEADSIPILEASGKVDHQSLFKLIDDTEHPLMIKDSQAEIRRPEKISC